MQHKHRMYIGLKMVERLCIKGVDRILESVPPRRAANEVGGVSVQHGGQTGIL